MKSFFSIVVILLAALVGACSKPAATNLTFEEKNFGQNPSGIIGGSAAVESDPFASSTVSLMTTYRGTLYSFCSGTLIAPDLVLTATHCVQNKTAEQILIFFGVKLPTAETDVNLVAVKSLKAHPQYHWDPVGAPDPRTGHNDVGLIHLASKAPAWTKPVPVMNDAALLPGQQLLLAGYGMLQEVPPQKSADGLYYTRVLLAKTFENILVTDQTHANGACAGDSGGPAYLETPQGLLVLGITRGPHLGASDCRHYGEYTYASRFKDYILQSAVEMGAETPIFVDAPAGSLNQTLNVSH